MVICMAYDPSYLGQNLNDRTKKTTHDFAVEMTHIASRMAGNGTLNSSMTFVQYWQAGLKVLELEANEACKFVYNLTEQHTGEPYDQLAYCVGRMVENMMQAAVEKASHMSALGGSYGDIVRAGPGCLNRVSASIGGASAGVRLPCGVAAG